MTNTTESAPSANQSAATLAPAKDFSPEEAAARPGAEREHLLRTDKAGRVRVPPERREAILDEFERSGMTGKAFAEHHGIKYPTFASWRSKRKRERAATGNSDSIGEESGGFTFLEVSAPGPVDSPPGERGLAVEFPGGARMILRGRDDLALAAELLRALG